MVTKTSACQLLCPAEEDRRLESGPQARAEELHTGVVSCPLPPPPFLAFRWWLSFQFSLGFLLTGSLAMSDVPKLRITLLGAGQEVGRSCCVLQYRGRTIVCDAGVHPAYSGIASLPFVDDLDWSTVDVLLITQYVLPGLS